MNEEIKLPKEEKISESEPIKEVPMRRIVILTNGTDIKLEEVNVAGSIELIAILNAVIGFVSKNLNK